MAHFVDVFPSSSCRWRYEYRWSICLISLDKVARKLLHLLYTSSPDSPSGKRKKNRPKVRLSDFAVRTLWGFSSLQKRERGFEISNSKHFINSIDWYSHCKKLHCKKLTKISKLLFSYSRFFSHPDYFHSNVRIFFILLFATITTMNLVNFLSIVVLDVILDDVPCPNRSFVRAAICKEGFSVKQLCEFFGSSQCLPFSSALIRRHVETG